MSNLNFESFENKSPKTTSHKSPKKPAKKKQKAPVGVIVGIGIAVVLGVLFLFSGGGSNSEKGRAAKSSSQPKPDSYMQGRLVEASRIMEVPASEIWKFYCNHDPDGYLHFLDSQYGDQGLSGKISEITYRQVSSNYDKIDDFTLLALIEVYRKHKERDDEYWQTYKHALKPIDKNAKPKTINLRDWKPPFPDVYSQASVLYEKRGSLSVDIQWSGNEF